MDSVISRDRKLHIATGASRWAKLWKNQEVLWSDFAKRLETASETGETPAQYQHMTKGQKDRAKDVGGFVGGYLDGGRRLQSRVKFRSLVTLDADTPAKSFKEDLEHVLAGRAYVLYSTHSHTAEAPRYRVLIPLDTDAEPDAYQAIARRLASDIGMQHFDPSTFDVCRLFYWPSKPRGGLYEYHNHPGTLLSVQDVLSTYVDWTDCTAWPTSATEAIARKRDIKKQGEPTEKPGFIGAFCRVYTVQDAIAKYLPDVYEPTADPDRYTYALGSTTGGLVIYDDRFAYSHHGTDPAGGVDCNAFDLVRLQLFGVQDEDVAADCPVNKRPSFKAMQELAASDDAVLLDYNQHKTRELQALWDDKLIDEDGKPTKVDKSWMKGLTAATGKRGGYESDSRNIKLILMRDPLLAGLAAWDEFQSRTVATGDLPWRQHAKNTIWSDTDDACLRNYLSQYYQITGKQVIDDALAEVTHINTIHPVREYLDSLVWDGTERLGRLYVDFLGAEDTEYTHALTITHAKAAVRRIYEPGCKFDNVLVLQGPQGIGKSTIIRQMMGPWVNDSIGDITGKDAMEGLKGSWGVELSEMQATNRAGTDQIKAYISKTEDKFRVAYGRRTEIFKRQCVFFATTNDDICLRDRTGGRRFWILECLGGTERGPMDMTQDEKDQYWAEAVCLYRENPSLLLPPDIERQARDVQEAKTEGSELQGVIEGYLDMPIPKNWDLMTVSERQHFIQYGDEAGDLADGRFLQVRTCAIAIWCECLGGNRVNFTNAKARELNTVLRNMPGWKPYKDNKSGKMRFKNYGVQRAYTRIKKTEK